MRLIGDKDHENVWR
ncbi:unnamed protein product, partial [Rotaria sp. Silwood1]